MSYYEGVGHILEVNTDVMTSCEHCAHLIDGTKDFAGAVNHYVDAHGYKILHIGTQTGLDLAMKPYQQTVAILGK